MMRPLSLNHVYLVVGPRVYQGLKALPFIHEQFANVEEKTQGAVLGTLVLALVLKIRRH
jgi:hypothetical protein